MNPPQVICLAALIVLAGVFITNLARAVRHSKPTNDPPLPTADGEYIPSDGDEGDLRGTYARHQRAQREAEAIQQRMGASVRMTSERLKVSTRRLNERRNDTER